MKREKRHGIERELSIKRIRSQKKYSILIVSVLLLTCTLIQIGFQMSEGLKAVLIMAAFWQAKRCQKSKLKMKEKDEENLS